MAKLTVPKSDYRWRMRFSKGTLIKGDGNLSTAKRFVDRLSSNGISLYTAILWEGTEEEEKSSVSCNCRGWATHRHCKHTQELLELTESETVERTALQSQKNPLPEGCDGLPAHLVSGARRAIKRRR